MVRTYKFLILAVLVSGAAFVYAQAGDHDHEHHAAAATPQTKCPIRGGDIDPEVFTDYKGKRIFFCCPGCDKTFLADADAKIKAMEESGITLATTPVAAAEQTLCPVSDEPIEKDKSVVYEGKTIYFCCNRCIKKFKAHPEAYLKKLEAQKTTAVPAPAPAHHDDNGHDAHHNH